MANKELPTLIGNLFLLVTVISAFTCLLRNDYNFAFCIFFYYIWINKRDADTVLIVLVGTVVLIVADVSWFAVIGGVWKTDVEDSKFWASMQFSYNIILFLSALSVIAKCGIVVLLQNYRKNPEEIANLIPSHQQDLH